MRFFRTKKILSKNPVAKKCSMEKKETKVRLVLLRVYIKDIEINEKTAKERAVESEFQSKVTDFRGRELR